MDRLVVIVLVIALSHSATSDDVQFFYYSAPGVPPIELQSTDISTINIDPEKEVKILCHGIVANSTVAWYAPMIDAYLENGDQVIAVDWGVYAFDAVLFLTNVDTVGNLIGQMIIDVHHKRRVPLSQFHVIGHSLGVHIVGYTGKYVINATSAKIGRITGLDGTSKIFMFDKETLGPSDAIFVDAIHTSIPDRYGQADFFVNGGHNQPACEEWGLLEEGCSHNIITDYFIESIKSNGFVAKKCETECHYQLGFCDEHDIAIMGDNCAFSASGSYYLDVNKEPPYAKG